MQSKMITGAVGKGPMVPNRPNDVKTVQALLNAQVSFGVTQQLELNGRVTPLLISRIEEFQRTVVRLTKPDGRVDPGGKTILALNKHQQAANAAKINFKLSDKATKLLKDVETGGGEPQLKAYDDQTQKEISKWVEGATIGYGHLISSAEWSTYQNGFTKAEAETLFNKDLAPFEMSVNSKVQVRISQQQFDALVILAFNIGRSGFESSSVLKLINDATAKTPYSNLDAAWKAWNKSQGKVMKGLENRRQAELNIYHKGVYKRW